MTAPVNVTELENALLSRAQTLAEEYLERARRSRDRTINEANEHLRLREDREMLVAKAIADRAYRRRVQQAELSRQEELDRLRWTLIRNVVEALNAELAKVAQDEERYLPILSAMLTQSAQSIESAELVCEVNATDWQLLAPRWPTFSQEAVPDRPITLGAEPRSCSGGLLLRTVDDRIRVDNTFEGRLDRLEEQIARVVMERLFATAAHRGGLF